MNFAGRHSLHIVPKASALEVAAGSAVITHKGAWGRYDVTA